MKSLRSIIWVCLLAASACAAQSNKAPSVVVLLLADDLGYGDLSCYGAEKIRTPNIDRLAAEGVRYVDAHSSSAVCTPSRYSLLTGRYAWRTRLKKGVLGGFDAPLIEADRPTLGTLFQRAGYKTACIGKWHLGMGWPVSDGKEPQAFGQNVDYTAALTDTPADRGFDTFFGISASLDFPPYAFIEDHHIVGTVSGPKEIRYDSQRPGAQVEGWDDLTVDTTFIEKAVEMIHGCAEAGDKCFIFLPLPAPHRPCIPPEIVEGKSEAGRRGDMVMLVDWGVGQLVEALEQENLLDQSMIVLTSDNGARPGDGWNPPELKFYHGTTQLPNRAEPDITEGYGPEEWVTYGHAANGDFRGYKTDIYEGGHRVPLVVYAPGQVEQPSVCDQPVGLTDWYATFSELLGVDCFAGGEDSISLLSTLKGEPSGRDHVVHHSAKGMFAVRQGNWKYVGGGGSGGVSKDGLGTDESGQLFDLSTDPGETVNVVKEHPEVVKVMKDKLDAVRR